MFLSGTSAVADDIHAFLTDPVSIDDPAAGLQAHRADGKTDPTATARCGPAAPAPVRDGQDIVVKLAPAPPFTVGEIKPASWRRPPVADPTWLLRYRGLLWIKPLARRAAMDGQLETLDALVDQVVRFHAENPDPNSSAHGWDEGTALRRLETENCLFALTGSAKLRQPMRNDVNVLFGFRYYGPPYAPVHNHGLMANLQILHAGNNLHREDWMDRATGRIVAEAPRAFSGRGVSWEQASGYQIANAKLWEQAADTLAGWPGTEPAVASIRRTLAKAQTVFTWMTEPDGGIVQIGDSEEIKGAAAAPPGAPRVFRDDETGWVIGRWSWTDPLTTYYTIRYGPERRAHGHHDRAGGVTFTTRGVRVLVGPGKYNYDGSSGFNAYQISPQGHNVPIPDAGRAGGGPSAVTGSRVRASVHAWTVRDTVYGTGRAHTRTVNVNRTAARMTVTDRFAGARPWRQYWHLDPQWVRVSGGVNGATMVFSHPSGRTLTVTTSGAVSSVAHGSGRPAAGWHFPRFGERAPGYEIQIRPDAATLTTSFTVD
ncbi:hypothetical protein [Actinoplanes sp. NPDC026623]|uniref:hypothetical protein n=1 Tax=Actinoplanes sp. NPDC026623 TaxID=3155610 RepID=UPI0033CE7334